MSGECAVPTVTLLALRSEKHRFDDPAGHIAGADEVLEVSAASAPALKLVAHDAGARFRYIQSRRRISRQLNLGISFSSSEWIVLSFCDESLKVGWLQLLKQRLAGVGDGVVLVTPAEGHSLPLVVARRNAFIFGSIDERFIADRLSALHWVYRIYAPAETRGRVYAGITEHRCDWLAPCLPIVEHAIVGLLELWEHLSVDVRAALLEQAVSVPERCLGDLRAQLALLRRGSSGPNVYSADSVYQPKEFWEANCRDYVKWEVYQPDEPEIQSILERTSPKSVLELGCGAGRNTRYFAGAERYAGVDLSMALLARAAERQEDNSIGIVCGDVTELSFADATFDLVFSDSTLQHVMPDKIERCVREIHRVSSRYICLIEYTEEIEEGGTWFQQSHIFSHDYARLFAPYAELLLRAEIKCRVHPAKKEVFLFLKR